VSRFLYLHGFASGPGSQKARIFRERFGAAGVDLRIPDLAEGDFEHLTLSGQLRVIEREAAGEALRLVGSSMGGYLAALYAAGHPLVERMVLLAPAFGFARRWAEGLGSEAVGKWRETGSISVFHFGDRQMRQLSFDLYRDAEQFDAYPDVSQPTLIFHGARDEVVPAAYSREFAALRPSATLEEVEDGHELLLHIDRISARALDFLTS
jgi:pimeloyl-ACP methyl ester carboxylesterase